MYTSKDWQFWAIGVAVIASSVASAVLETLLPLVIAGGVVIVLGAVSEWLETRRRHRSRK